jgi:hypothetical protein
MNASKTVVAIFAPILQGGGGGGGGGGGSIGGGGGGGGASTKDKRITSLGSSIGQDGVVFDNVEAESLDGDLRLKIPRSTVALNRLGNFLNSVSVTTLNETPAPAENESVIGTAYELGPAGANFDPPVTLTLRYNDSEVPSGMLETSLVIANWDPVKEDWIPVNSTVDAGNNNVTAKISHFSIYAVLGKEAPPAPNPPPAATNNPEPAEPVEPEPALTAEPLQAEPTALRPASFTVSSLSVTPAEVNAGRQVTVTALITNTGESNSSFSAVLNINGAEETRKEVTLEGGMTETVSFTFSKDTPGTYTIDIAGNSGQFIVSAPPPPAPPNLATTLPEESGGNNMTFAWIIAGVVVIGGISAFSIIRKKQKRAQ